MWWLFTKKIENHQDIDHSEKVLHACYGLGGKIVEKANRKISSRTNTWKQFEAAKEGLAEPLDRSGIIALTDRRLCFFAKRFAIGSPKRMTAHWPLETLRSISYDEDTLGIKFIDESIAGLHVPNSQSPQKLILEFNRLRNDV